MAYYINKTIMRCLTKNLAMFGLGLYIYAGEDLPESEKEEIEYATAEQIAELKTLVADLDAVAKYLKKDNINQLTKVEIQNIIDRKKKAN